MWRVLAATLVFALGAPAGAAARDAGPAEADAGPDAVDWDEAPRADQASGVARAPNRGLAPLLWIPRVILFVPRWAFFVAAQPVRLAGWAYERYQLRDRFEQVFFNVDGTFGVYPVAFFETGFGFNVGARLVHKDLFGDGESLRMRAGFGGRFEQIYTLRVATGDRFDALDASLELRYERRPEERFFGFGNNDEISAAEVMTPVDPLTSDAALDARFRQRIAYAKLGVVRALTGDLSARLSGALVLRRFEPADRTDSIENFYDTDRLPGFSNRDSFLGFSNGVQNLYTELELRYDTRRRTNEYRTHAVPATGWMLSGYAGYMHGIAKDPSAFVRYGADLQRLIDLYDGGRVLALRVLVETTGGTDGQTAAMLAEIPFVDLPRLGGATTLRGYEADRFTDRAITLGTVEYIYDLVPQLSAYAFVDAGRVFRTLKDFELEDFRVGYGAGIRAHTKDSFLTRVHVSTSIDGGIFFNFSFSPAFKRRERAGKYR